MDSINCFFPDYAIRQMELQRNTYQVYRLMCHLVWIPNYRHNVFVETLSRWDFDSPHSSSF
jgi:hypothetical protein